MQTTYDGEHSIIFDGKDTWLDFGLVPSSRPSVALPPVKTNSIEIPGANGVIDMTEIPLGYPVYGMRSGSWDFILAHDVTGLTWDETYAILSAFFHGKKHKCILSDDRSYYYEGRFSIDDIKSDKTYSSITINYELNPFKWMIWSTTEDWLWNPFDFIYGEIPQDEFKFIRVDGQTGFRWTQNQLGSAPLTPTITVQSSDQQGMTFYYNCSFTNATIGTRTVAIPDGDYYDPQIEFMCPTTDDFMDITIIGNGLISIDFRPGRL